LAPILVYRLAVPVDTPPWDNCPHCDQSLPVGWRGWLRLGSRCPACRAPLTAHQWVYPALTAAGFAALAARLPIRTVAEAVLLVAWLVLVAAGVVLSGIDVQVNRLPLPILGGCAALLCPLVIVAAVSARNPSFLVRAGLAAAVFGCVYLVLAVAGPGLVGQGDAYLAALLGLLLGTGPMATILAGALLPYALGFPVTAVRLSLRSIQRSSKIALGPYLIAGAILARTLIPS
jgi:leader peptidase (prepilin peptidase)/N-methyltransferase